MRTAAAERGAAIGPIHPAPLAILAAVVTAAGALGIVPRWPGLLHAVALPPLALIGDIGALLTWTDSAPLFVVGALTSLALRTVVLAAMLGGLDAARLGFALRFQLIVWPIAALAAALQYAAGAVLFYALFWGGLFVSLALVLFTAAAPWAATTPSVRQGFARAARSGFRAGTVGAYLAVLLLLGYVADHTAPVGPVVLVPVAALATWAAAYVLHTDPGWRWIRRTIAAIPATGVIALVAIVLTGPAGPPRADEPAEPLDGSIMLMSGIDSSSGSGAILELDPHALGWTCERTFYFSYAGPGNGQPRNDALCDIEHGAPYEAQDTMRSREELVPFLREQAAEMDEPALVAGHSQGAWLTWDAASLGELEGVEGIVLVGPFPQNPASYPDEADAGFGHVGRAVIAFVAEADRPGGTSVFEVDSPLGREWLGDPERITDTFARPLPDDMRALSVPSTFDLPLMPEGHEIAGTTGACPVPVIHPNLPYAGEFHDVVTRFAQGREQPGCPWWRTEVGPLLRSFTVPPDR